MITFNDDFFKESDKDYKNLKQHHYYKSVKDNVVYKDGKRVKKQTQVEEDKDG